MENSKSALTQDQVNQKIDTIMAISMNIYKRILQSKK